MTEKPADTNAAGHAPVRRRWRAQLAVLVLLLLSSAGSAYVGVAVGYAIGELQGQMQRSAPRAFVLASQLRSLRAGNADSVIDSLESELDTLIIQNGIYDTATDARYGWLADMISGDSPEGQLDRTRTFMGDVSKYRSEVPSRTESAVIKRRIDSELAAYPPLECSSTCSGTP